MPKEADPDPSSSHHKLQTALGWFKAVPPPFIIWLALAVISFLLFLMELGGGIYVVVHYGESVIGRFIPVSAAVGLLFTGVTVGLYPMVLKKVRQFQKGY